MDAFTENILARARERQRLLREYGTTTPLKETTNTSSSEPILTDQNNETKKISSRKEVVSDSNLAIKVTPQKENVSEGKFSRQNSKTSISSDLPGTPLHISKTLNIEREDFNLEIKLSSTENVRVQVEIENDSDTEIENCETDSQGSEPCIREESKNRLKRLGKLYAGGDDADISSPIHRTEAKFYEIEHSETRNVEVIKNVGKSKNRGLSKLANLAQEMNSWEDDLNHPTPKITEKPSPQKSWKPHAPQPEKMSPQKKKSTPPKKYKAPQPPTPKSESPKIKTVSTTPASSTKEVNGKNSSPSKKVENVDKGAQCVGATPKKLNWDPKVLDSLEKEKQIIPPKNIPEENEEPISKVKQLSSKIEQKIPKSPTKITGSVVSKQAALFENRASPSKNTKDPALLSVSERKALFEKNKGTALVPKAAFGMSAPVKVDTIMKASETKLIGANKNCEKLNREKTPPKKGPAPKPPVVENKSKVEPKIQTTAAVHQAGGIASKMAALLENKSTISQEQIENKIKEQRQQEMDLLLNRFNKNKEVTHDVIKEVTEDSDSESDNENVTEMTAMIKQKAAKIIKSSSKENIAKPTERKSGGKRVSTESLDSPKVISVVEDVKRIKISPPKAGRLYPNLSDIEATTETDTRSPSPDYNSSSEENEDDDAVNTSFGRDILQTICQNQTPQKRPSQESSTTDDNNSTFTEELDEILEEYDLESDAAGPTPAKQIKNYSPRSPKVKNLAQPSNSFAYKSFQSPKHVENLPEYVVEGDDILPLTHTVSFYRKQQNQAVTPVRQISRNIIVEESSEESENSSAIDEKIQKMQTEVTKQENIISQTSQALNLCNSTLEFAGSTEQVEAEKVLLVATHRRQAALHELQRLKVERTLRPHGKHSENVPLEKGVLTISNIVLPMKKKYVTALAAAGGKGHHVVCLIKCGEQVFPTKLVSTAASNSKNPDLDLVVPGSVILNDIYSDFAVSFEVYCLQAQEECLPHELKYHIQSKSSKKITTPKKSKQDSRLFRKITESPAGPQAVRTSSFALMGRVTFSVQTCSKKSWSLINTPSMSPLEGIVEMQISCELALSVEHRGFLTMFEDISGFGAWHRRWCMLKGDTLSYWKYPDDEKKMPPIDTINLKSCINEKVGPVSRDICARLHTFLIETERLASPHDRDTLVCVRNGEKTVIRHLLSADTKEERVEWCGKFNAALTALKMWGNNKH